jgi:hypothetical protein
VLRQLELVLTAEGLPCVCIQVVAAKAAAKARGSQSSGARSTLLTASQQHEQV